MRILNKLILYKQAKEDDIKDDFDDIRGRQKK